MKPLKAAATFVVFLAACVALLFVIAAPFNWFTGQNPNRRVGDYFVHQLGGDAGDVHGIDCRAARESPTAGKPSALFDCAVEGEEPIELELEGGSLVRLEAGKSACASRFGAPGSRGHSSPRSRPVSFESAGASLVRHHLRVNVNVTV
jgi:hypothetical protein